MDKIKNHFKNNAIIYLILLLCLVILGIAIFVKGQNKLEEVDTSLFDVISLDKANSLFDDNDPKLLLISTKTCQATVKYQPTLTIAAAKEEIKVYYLELTDINKEDRAVMEKFYKFQEKLDYPYMYRGEEKPIGEFIGSTPMTIIIKNKKVVFAYIGSMSQETIRSFIERYMK